jgi:threonine/homoserine/homoserine lactone efflux protein
MIEDYEQKRRKQMTRMRSVTDYVMGIIFICFGIYFLIYERLGINIFQREPSPVDYVIGGLFVLYGGWRLYRGYRKNYFRNEEA